MNDFQKSAPKISSSAPSPALTLVPSASATASQSPRDLHAEFVRLGRERRNLTYKLLAILPEIYKQEIYKKHGYNTIYEYAGIIAGLSDYVVTKTLRLDKNLENKPFLRQAVTTQGIHKVDLVARLATAQSDRAWADKVENMSKASLQELSKEVRSKEGMMGEIANGGENLFGNNENNLGINSAENQLFCQAAAQKLMIELDAEMQFLFLKIKNEVGKNLSNKETLRQILKQYEDISSKFSKIKSVREIQPPQPVQPVSAPQSPPQKSLPGENFPKNLRSARSALITRYIPAQQKRITLSQTQNHCAYPNCQRPPEILHHRDRFAVSQNHDSVIPLCKIHHEFAHNGIIAEEQKPPTNWQFKLSDLKAQNSEAAKTDFLYRSYRNS